MKPKFVIRDCHAVLNGSKTVHTMDGGGIDIVTENGNSLFSIYLTDDGMGIEVSASSTTMVGGEILNDTIAVKPRASNLVHIIRLPYTETKHKPTRGKG